LGKRDEHSVLFYIKMALEEVDYLIEQRARLADVEPASWDGTTRRAIEKAVENIGEAVYKIEGLDKDIFLKYPGVEWAKIEGMRHRVVHEYWGISPAILWSVTCDHVPTLGDVPRQIVADHSAAPRKPGE
jgi:uncharacterized protein with HEPN domain